MHNSARLKGSFCHSDIRTEAIQPRVPVFAELLSGRVWGFTLRQADTSQPASQPGMGLVEPVRRWKGWLVPDKAQKAFGPRESGCEGRRVPALPGLCCLLALSCLPNP